MGEPDGGWYDETPPKIVSASPPDKATGVSGKHVSILFDEYIKVDNPTEKVIVSPPQLETPDIKGEGKHITVKLKDDLQPNTTYTIDFSDAISDNNEGNPLGNYTYSFSTGSQIDTMEVAGYVLSAENLEPVKGILVGLYKNQADTAFTRLPMLRVARTDASGHFVVKGVAKGDYRIYALRDADANYRFSQQSEEIAFTPEVIMPSCQPDVRQDTIWRDSLHIKDIQQTPYTHFFPDDVVLTSFTEAQTARYFLKAERKEPDYFSVIFSYGDTNLPEIKGLNFNAVDAFIVEPSLNQDSIGYWLRDTALVHQDTLKMTIRYNMTDTLGQLTTQIDTLEVLAKTPYAKRLKRQQEAYAKWKKQQDRNRQRGKDYQTEMPSEALEVKYNVSSRMSPDENPTFMMPSPLAVCDTAKIHLYEKIDTLWYRAHYQFGKVPGQARCYKLVGAWNPGHEYSLETDSAAFVDIYGKASKKHKQGINVGALEEYGTLAITLQGMEGRNCLLQLLDGSDKPVRETTVKDGIAHFYYIEPGKYYLRLIVDDNDNGHWDTGDYNVQRQPEVVCYYPKPIDCKAKWDLHETWNPRALPLYLQKPAAITKQKGDQKKTVRNRNAERARKLGIEYNAKGKPAADAAQKGKKN